MQVSQDVARYSYGRSTYAAAFAAFKGETVSCDINQQGTVSKHPAVTVPLLRRTRPSTSCFRKHAATATLCFCLPVLWIRRRLTGFLLLCLVPHC